MNWIATVATAATVVVFVNCSNTLQFTQATKNTSLNIKNALFELMLVKCSLLFYRAVIIFYGLWFIDAILLRLAGFFFLAHSSSFVCMENWTPHATLLRIYIHRFYRFAINSLSIYLSIHFYVWTKCVCVSASMFI